MMQQINLYPLLPKSPRYKITPRHSVHICAGFLGLLILLYLLNLAGYCWQQYHLASLEHQQRSAQQQLNTLEAQFAALQNKPLSWQNEQLAAELSAKQAILAKISQTSPTGYQGYAKYLTGLAVTIVPDVWLTAIHIKTDKQQIELTGSSTNSTAIMQFIQNLSKNVMFNNKTFNVLHLENSTENAQIINFTLSTVVREQNANNPARKTQ